jgi:Tfp pilus assembly protein PilX
MNRATTMKRLACAAKLQRGVVLFLALIALVILSLAAVALIRSVDTNTVIAGNLGFKRAAISSGDAGTEAAMAWLTAKQAANVTKNVLSDTSHEFNISAPSQGYYSNADPALDIYASSTWSTSASGSGGTDEAGNTMRYIIQRMCRTPNVAVKDADCLFSGATVNNSGQQIPLPQDICSGPGCPAAGQTPMIRVTTRVIGPKNTISYLQGFIY